MLFKVMAEEQCEYCAVAFDLHAPTFRHLDYPEYKAGRAPTPEELKPQVDLIQDLLEKMHIPRLGLEGYEADDILGTVSARAAAMGVDCLIITGGPGRLPARRGQGEHPVHQARHQRHHPGYPGLYSGALWGDAPSDDRR